MRKARKQEMQRMRIHWHPPQEQQFVPSPIAPHEVQVGRWGAGALLSCFPAFLINQENRWGAVGGGLMNEESKKAGNAENENPLASPSGTTIRSLSHCPTRRGGEAVGCCFPTFLIYKSGVRHGRPGQRFILYFPWTTIACGPAGRGDFFRNTGLKALCFVRAAFQAGKR